MYYCFNPESDPSNYCCYFFELYKHIMLCLGQIYTWILWSMDSLISLLVIHTLLILFQATVLLVAFNSHNKALLTVMMSNNVSTPFILVDNRKLFTLILLCTLLFVSLWSILNMLWTFGRICKFPVPTESISLISWLKYWNKHSHENCAWVNLMYTRVECEK